MSTERTCTCGTRAGKHKSTCALYSTSFIRIRPHTPATKRPSYMDALDYIARNDEPESRDVDFMDGFASVQLVASIFGIPPRAVAFDVVRVREIIAKEEA